MTIMALTGFAMGAAAMGTVAHQGWLRPLGIAPWTLTPEPVLPSGAALSSTAAIARTQGAMETRVQQLEDKLNRLDLEAAAASGNAVRAEALLVALPRGAWSNAAPRWAIWKTNSTPVSARPSPPPSPPSPPLPMIPSRWTG
jgi:hypothetical protein